VNRCGSNEHATVYFQGAEGMKEAPITDLLPEGFRLK